MLQFPLWKTLLVWAVVLVGCLFAAPNLVYDRVERANDARTAIAAGAAATPAQAADAAGWPDWLPSGLVNLGLDLRGGVYLLVEVAVEDVYADRTQAMWPELRDALRAVPGIASVRRIEGPADELRVRIDNPEALPAALTAARALAQPVTSALLAAGADNIEVTGGGEGVVVLRLSEAERRASDERTVAQSLEIIRRRVDEAGTREPSIQRQGAQRIVVQVPGVGSADELMAIIGQTAKLSFHPVIRAAGPGEPVGLDELLLPEADREGFLVLERAAVVGGDDLVDSQASFDQNGQPAVSFRFDAVGARKFGDYTRDNIGKLFAIVLDDTVISAPQIQSHIAGGSGIITGRFTVEEATNLSILLRAGALPAEIRVLEQRTVGPELGRDSIEAGRLASLVAFGAVLVFMVLTYGLFGLFGSIALLCNIILIFAVMSVIGATLTLPGIAGVVLTIGMAVDANVLIYERIREELRTAKGVSRAIELGFDRALTSITDANVTTLIACVIMYWIGSGPVRGFAVTLAIGVLTSVFTAIFVTRVLIAAWFARTRPKSITL